MHGYINMSGIRVLEPGFKRFIIRIPEIPRASYASASYNSIREANCCELELF